MATRGKDKNLLDSKQNRQIFRREKLGTLEQKWQ